MSVKSRSNNIASSCNSNQGGSFEGFRPSPIAAALLLAIGGVPAWAAEQSPGANNITLGGVFNTGTTMTANGAVTDIRTTTVSGNTGFNSFGHFNVNEGNTVNLHVPAGKANLVNLVRDSKAVINGTLNGFKDGSIGGNIIFADPHGLVVGASGVVNVGSLTITTPSPEQMGLMVLAIASGDDTLGDKITDDLMAGKYNGGSGKVEIKGVLVLSSNSN